ncbi:glycosyltransferase family 32 protein [Flavobacterium sp. LB1P71]|uniref:glycosyltransferase family 32 protein n=1 Tax=unclassified Flavobacterium TaxID=196869 RepID=UPI003AAABE94
MIPKVIHYCWFGGKRKPKLIKDCILSWKIHLPDYEIKEWNEKNSDLTIPFVNEAYKLKKWAFVADYIRLKILYENGGIYLDTDMMVIKSFDSLLSDECFFGVEDERFISAGIIGVKKKHPFIKKCLFKYESIKLDSKTDWNQITMPIFITGLFRDLFSFDSSFEKTLKYEMITIYPVSYFYPFPNKKKHDINNYKNYIENSTFAVHLWNASWVEYDEFYFFKNREYFKGFLMSFRKIFYDGKISFSYMKKIFLSIKISLK